MPADRTGKLLSLALGLMVAAVSLFGAWRLAEGLSVAMGWDGLALAIIVMSGLTGVTWFAVRRVRLRQ